MFLELGERVLSIGLQFAKPLQEGLGTKNN